MSPEEVGRALGEREARNRVRSKTIRLRGTTSPHWDITIGTDDSIISMEVKVLRWNGKPSDGTEAINDFQRFQESLQEWIREQGWRLEIESYLPDDEIPF